MHTFKFSLGLKFLLVCTLLAFATPAHTLTLDPLDGNYVLYGDENSQNAINAIIDPYVAPSVQLYEHNRDNGSTIGLLSSSYETHLGENDGTITYIADKPIIPPIAWLSIKDGNASPNWYLFNLTELGWDGYETIYLENFWGKDAEGISINGSISNVRLYGVPEPGTIFLLGAGLVGLVAVSRRKFRK